MEFVLLALAGMFLLNRAKAQPRQPSDGGGQGSGAPQTPLPNGGGDTSPQSAAGGGPSVGAIVGSVAGTVTAVVGLASTIAGAAGGGATVAGGTAIAATTVGTTTAVAGGGSTAAAGGAAGGTGAAVAATAGGTSAAAAFGYAAIVIGFYVSMLLTFWGLWTASSRASRWANWTNRPIRKRYAGLLFKDEVDTLSAILDPIDPATGTPPLDPVTGQPAASKIGAREYVEYLGYWNENVSMYVPRDWKLSGGDALRLARLARWCAIERLDAYNAAQYNFWNAMGEDPIANNRGLPQDKFNQFIEELCGGELYAAEAGYRCAASRAQLESVASGAFSANLALARKNIRFMGAMTALKEAAVQGYSFGWPGDHEFTSECVRRCGLGDGLARMDPKRVTDAFGGGWYVEYVNVGGSFRWLAFDNLTNWAIDVVKSREREGAVIFGPEQTLLQESEKAIEVIATPEAQQSQLTGTQAKFATGGLTVGARR